MSWVFLFPAFTFGFAVGIAFAASRYSKWKKDFDVEIKAKSAELAEKDNAALLDFQKKWDEQLIKYRKELDKMMMEEHLIKAEFPEDEDRIN